MFTEPTSSTKLPQVVQQLKFAMETAGCGHNNIIIHCYGGSLDNRKLSRSDKRIRIIITIVLSMAITVKKGENISFVVRKQLHVCVR